MLIERAFISITSVRVSFFGSETRYLASRYGGVHVVREGRPYGAKLSGFECKLTLKNCWMPSINPVLENGLIHLLLQTDLYPQYSSTAWETPHDSYPGIYSNLTESVNAAFNRLSLLLGPFRATCGSIRENTRAVGNEGNHHKKAHMCRNIRMRHENIQQNGVAKAKPENTSVHVCAAKVFRFFNNIIVPGFH